MGPCLLSVAEKRSRALGPGIQGAAGTVSAGRSTQAAHSQRRAKLRQHELQRPHLESGAAAPASK